jgi:hypothetical protein
MEKQTAEKLSNAREENKGRVGFQQTGKRFISLEKSDKWNRVNCTNIQFYIQYRRLVILLETELLKDSLNTGKTWLVTDKRFEQPDNRNLCSELDRPDKVML